jgi:MFS family permease
MLLKPLCENKMNNEQIQSRAPWALAYLLLLANIMSFIDRMLLTLLVKPIRAELMITDTQISLLHGLAFAVFYALFGLPLGRLADSVNRPKLISGGIGLWSAMTAACAAATSFVGLFVARIGVAIGEATLSPAAISLLAEKFPKQLVARAIGVFQSGIFIGSGLALLAGGSLLGWLEKHDLSNLGPLSGLSPWRLVFLCVGAPGILLAIAFLFVSDKNRSTPKLAQSAATPFKDAVKYVLQNKSLYFGHILTFTAITILAYGSLSWMPTVMVRSHDVATAQVGLYLGVIMLVAGPMGVMFSSWLLDSFVKNKKQNGLVTIALIAAVLLGVAVPAYALAPNLGMALAAACLLAFAQSFPYGIASSALTMVTPAHFRGQIIALYLMISNLFGLTLGPLLVARMTDGYFHDDAMIKYSLALLPLLTVPFAFIGVAVCRAPFKKAMANLA